MTRDALVLIAAVAALFLSGCRTEAPPSRADIQRDALAKVDMRESWTAGGASGPVADNWLVTFNDTDLDALVHEATMNNLDLRVAASRVAQAAQYVELARAAMRPAIGVLGTGGLKGGGGTDVTSALQGIVLGVSWEPDLWGRMRYGRNAAQETSISVQADYEFARQSIAATVAKSWFTVTETWLQERIAEEMVKSSEQLLQLASKRQDVGAGTEEDEALARASVATFQDSFKQFQLAHEQALRALETVLGRYPSAGLTARRDLPALPGPVPSGMPLEILERRPDMIAAERRVASAFNRVGEAKAARLPRIVLSASGSFIDSQVLQLQPDFENPTGGIGGRLIAPIYDGGSLKTQVEIRTLEQEQAVAEYARMALRAIADVENALAAGTILSERYALLVRAVAENERALNLVQTSYSIGKADLRAVQQQELGVFSSRIALLRVQSEQLSRRVDLHLALGGSFEQLPPPATNVASNDK